MQHSILLISSILLIGFYCTIYIMMISIIIRNSFTQYCFSDADGIDNGRIADPGEFKYSVRLSILPNDICGGGIISVKHILTAGHCVWQKSRKDIEVLAGTNYLYDEGVKRNVRCIAIHEGFRPAVSMDRSFCRPCLDRIYPCIWEPRLAQIPKNDVAVLTLDQELPMNDLIGTIPYKPAPDFVLFCVCDFSGWGRMNDVQQSLHLRASTMDILSRGECKHRRFKHRHNEMCAMDLTRETAPMKGDSGNLLVCDNVAVGLLSVGTGYLDFPAIFAKIADQVDFIDGIVNSPSLL